MCAYTSVTGPPVPTISRAGPDNSGGRACTGVGDRVALGVPSISCATKPVPKGHSHRAQTGWPNPGVNAQGAGSIIT